jgi:DsbC/DsbD-like thiol-disulfide interchange protein/cytochrome c biogenesis protein CcdA
MGRVVVPGNLWRALAAAILLLVAVGRPAAAQIGASRHLALTLVAETPTPAAGTKVTLALAATPEPGWHGYWKNTGDAGVETRLDWALPAGLRAGDPRYPVPRRLLIAGLMNYVYEKPYALLVDLSVPAGLAPGTRLPVRVKADYLVCTDQLCVPESATLETALTVGDGAIAPATRARFDAWRQALPRPLGSPARFALAAGKLRLAIPFPQEVGAGEPYFYPLGPSIAYAAPQTVTRQGDTLVLETTAAQGEAPTRVEGVLGTGDGRGFALVAAPGEVAAPGTDGWRTALLALLGAVAGGVLLNIMPCVFPILSLKALSLAKAGTDERAARRDALAYTAGVVLVCLALGGVLLALRAGGATLGWAFQLQHPGVILALLLLTAGIALNLAGLFELPMPRFATRGGGAGAFATGALAAFVATPCSGPFMGAALGAALVLPTLAALLVFAGLGLGIALPFLLVGFVPALRRRLPRPGRWMATFRRILAVPMALTALALGWVLWRQAGERGLFLGLAALAALAAALWWLGRRQMRGGGGWLLVPALALCLGAIVLVRPEARSAAMQGEPFSERRLATLRAEGRPVFAYFTADWCLTCKVNEKAAIETAATRAAFRAGGVAVLVGDWTDGDPALGRFIEAHGRAGVPLYLYYPRGAREPRVLPQLLTPGMLEAL